jgi:hypothetical protein
MFFVISNAIKEVSKNNFYCYKKTLVLHFKIFIKNAKIN